MTNLIIQAANLIATNSVTFQSYALSLLLSQANLVNDKWELGLPKPVPPDDVVWKAKPMATGVEGVISTKDGRYLWSFLEGRLEIFLDRQYSANSFLGNDKKKDALLQMTNQLTKANADKIAREALKRLGFTEARLCLRTPPKVSQWKYDTGSKTVGLPLYVVEWIDKEDKDWKPVYMEVSGITRKVVKYSNHSRSTPRIPLPANYYEMTGIRPATTPSREPPRPP